MLIPALTMLALDGIYLTSTKSYFNKQITAVQGGPIQMRIIPTVVVYFFLLLSLYYFVIRVKGTPFDAFVLGISTYAVYEFTNYAILSKWSPITVAMDTIWGGVLFFLTTLVYYKLKN
jgi:uncharacterized membrane protein